jgi:hypothetical protein
MRLDGEDARVQSASLVANVVAHKIFARFEDAPEQGREGHYGAQPLAFKCFDRRIACGELAHKILGAPCLDSETRETTWRSVGYHEPHPVKTTASSIAEYSDFQTTYLLFSSTFVPCKPRLFAAQKLLQTVQIFCS